MSKVLALLLAVLMLVSMLAACGNTQSDPTDGATEPPNSGNEENAGSENNQGGEVSTGLQPEEGASLTLWFDNDTYNEEIVALWNAKYPDVPLTVINVGTTDARQKNELEGPTGTGADVFVMAHDGVAVSAQAGNILEIDLLADEVRSSFPD